MSFRMGIDIGGTFTDFFVVGDRGPCAAHKTASTPDSPARAAAIGIAEVAQQLGLATTEFLGQVAMIVHGTTVATNALLTRQGARTGLLTTKGFRDVLALRDGTREANYDNRVQPPRPLVPRHLCVGIKERMGSEGEVREPLLEDDVRIAADIVGAEGIEAVAVSFMHSPTNPEHERAAVELLRRLLPNVYVTASNEVVSQIRYYDRTSTTVLNAYVGPVMSRYLDEFSVELSRSGFDGILLVMQSNGGVASPREISTRAANALLSGPASGPSAGLLAVAPHGHRDCLTVDMGGTSFEAALAKDGAPLVMTDGTIDRWRLALPMIDIHTIGAGGGSIARVDEGGLLRVGPESAGARPGPACYGLGGELATVTDADLVLGYIDSDSFLGGRVQLDSDAAARAIKHHVADALDLEVPVAASGIFNVVNVNMAAGVREVTVRRGLDARDFPLVVAGGAGPVHASAIARELETPLVLVPRESSIFCAVGMLLCDLKHDYVQSHKARLADLDSTTLLDLWTSMRTRGRETLHREGIDALAINVSPSLDMRYAGQWWEINVLVPSEMVDAPDPERIASDFHDRHDRLFGYHSPEIPIDVLNVRLTVAGRAAKPLTQAHVGSHEGPDAGYIRHRSMWSPVGGGYVDAPVFDGQRLGTGAELVGPAIVELPATTMVLFDADALKVDSSGSFILTRHPSPNAPVAVTGTQDDAGTNGNT